MAVEDCLACGGAGGGVQFGAGGWVVMGVKDSCGVSGIM